MMGQKSPQVIGRKVSFNDNIRENNSESEIGDAPAEFVIVGEEVDNRLKSSNSLQIRSPEGKR